MFPRFTELPPVPVIYINGARQVSLIAGPYDENTDLSLICEVAGGKSINIDDCVGINGNI